jgi:dihydroorotate dehydrogenase (fumarate)
MDLTTRYLGLELPHPFMPGASPLADDLDSVRRLEDAGAAAIVMRSLFEEQLAAEQLATVGALDSVAESFPEAHSFLPAPEDFALGPEEYLDQLLRIREAVDIPVIASLNGTEGGYWLQYANLIAEAGADALELNVFDIETDPEASGTQVEDRLLRMVWRLREQLEIPVAVKLAPFYSAFLNLAARLANAGADGLVIFNRYFQADIDVEGLEVERTLELSDPSELALRLRWLAILSGKLDVSLAVTGGVHSPEDAIKGLMCGADVVQVVSALLLQGPETLASIRQGVVDWLEDHEYESLAQLRGSMNVARCPDPTIYERANYIHLLQSFSRPV